MPRAPRSTPSAPSAPGGEPAAGESAAPVQAGARERLLDAAFDLFHGRGIRATSVEEILARSGTGKSQFYHYFGSKDGLIQAVVERFETQLLAGELPGSDALETLEDLERWFGAFLEFQRATGCARFCPMATIASGLNADQEPIRLVVDRVFQHARGTLEAFFVKLADGGQLPATTSPAALADFCYTVMQGGLLVSRVRLDPTPFENAVKHTMDHIRRTVNEAAPPSPS